MQRNSIFLTLVFLLFSSFCANSRSVIRNPVVEKSDDKTARTYGSEPDYSNLKNWAASPFKKDASDSIPAFLKDVKRDIRVDVFFIHPTSYFGEEETSPWNADLNDATVNNETDSKSILFQASVFNGSCRVFAPRYRQANMKAFYVFGTPIANKAFDLAYSDVKNAFLYFLKHYNNNRPIIIASHSQGSLHAIRLLQELFDGKPLQNRLVCAYIVGYQIKKETFKLLPLGERPDQTGCFVGWRSYAKGEIPKSIEAEDGNSVCVNPLTWATNEQWTSSELHMGIMNSFETIVPHTVSAGIEPSSKILWIDTPVVLGEKKGPIKNYHVWDYNLFWMNIRQNVKLRIDAFNSGLPKPRHGNTYVIAHRGAHVGIPENSLAAIQKAIDLGCDFVEIDTRMTKDGRIVSVHNASVDEYVTGKTGKVKDFTLEEIKKLDIGEKAGPGWKNTRIPTVEEILQLCQGKIGIYLDLKEPLVPELLRIIHKYGMESDIIWYIVASRMEIIKQLKTLCPDCIPTPDPGPEKNILEVVNQVHPSILASDMGQLSESFVKTAHAGNSKVFVDEKNGTPEEWNQIINWGTDGIQTDNPAALIEYLKTRK